MHMTPFNLSSLEAVVKFQNPVGIGNDREDNGGSHGDPLMFTLFSMKLT